MEYNANIVLEIGLNRDLKQGLWCFIKEFTLKANHQAQTLMSQTPIFHIMKDSIVNEFKSVTLCSI